LLAELIADSMGGTLGGGTTNGKTRIRINTTVCLAALSILAIAGISKAQDKQLSAMEIVDKLQARYATIEDYKATFVQTTAHKLFQGRLRRYYGEIMYKKGGLMRWEYTRPESKFWIYDGETLWVYEPEVPQIIKGTADAERLRRAMAFLTGEGKILDQYRAKTVDPKKLGFAGGLVLKLYPKDKTSAFKHIELYIDVKSFTVQRSVVVDQEGNRNRLDFKTPATNSGLSPDLFKFKAPQGVPVINTDKMKQ